MVVKSGQPDVTTALRVDRAIPPNLFLLGPETRHRLASVAPLNVQFVKLINCLNDQTILLEKPGELNTRTIETILTYSKLFKLIQT